MKCTWALLDLALLACVLAATDPSLTGNVERDAELGNMYPPFSTVTHVITKFTDEEKRQGMLAGPIDWRTHGAVTPPTSQGRCSTCAYFAGVAAVEGAWKIAGHPLVKLSEQEEIDCYNNGGYAMPNMVNGIAQAIDAPLANHSDPNITGCRGITNCSHAKAHAFAKIDGIRGSRTHDDADVLALLRSGPPPFRLTPVHTMYITAG